MMSGLKMNSPTDFKKGIAIQPNPEMTRAEHLKTLEQRLISLYVSLEGWDEFGADNIVLVYNIQRKLLIYKEVYELLGELSGECERFALWCDAQKKNMFEEQMEILEEEPGTVKMKEIKANITGKKYRINRDYFMGLAKLWERRRESTLEAINILKWMVKDAHETMRGN